MNTLQLKSGRQATEFDLDRTRSPLEQTDQTVSAVYHQGHSLKGPSDVSRLANTDPSFQAFQPKMASLTQPPNMHPLVNMEKKAAVPLVQPVYTDPSDDDNEPFPLGSLDMFRFYHEDDMQLSERLKPDLVTSEANQTILERPIVDQKPEAMTSTSSNPQSVYFHDIEYLVLQAKPGNINEALTSIHQKWAELQGLVDNVSRDPNAQASRGKKRTARYEPNDGVERSPAQEREWRMANRKIRNRYSAAKSRQHIKNKLEALESVVPKFKELQHYLDQIQALYSQSKGNE